MTAEKHMPVQACAQLRVERHDHDGGLIAYEVWLNGGDFLFSIYEGDFDAKAMADRIAHVFNVHGELLEALLLARRRFAESLELMEASCTGGPFVQINAAIAKAESR